MTGRCPRPLFALHKSLSYVSSPCLKKRAAAGKIANAYLGWGSSTLNETALAATDNDIVFTGSFSTPPSSGGIHVYDNKETTVLGGAELFKFFGALYNKEAEAYTLYSTVQTRYECISSKAQNTPEITSKKILWCSYSTWYSTEHTWSCAKCPNYYCEHIQALGASILEYETTPGITGQSYQGSTPYLNDANMTELGKDADVWIFAGGDFS